MRHLHDRVNVLETRTAPPKEESHAADVSTLGFGAPLMGLGNETLMITNAPAYGTSILALSV